MTHQVCHEHTTPCIVCSHYTLLAYSKYCVISGEIIANERDAGSTSYNDAQDAAKEASSQHDNGTADLAGET